MFKRWRVAAPRCAATGLCALAVACGGGGGGAGGGGSASGNFTVSLDKTEMDVTGETGAPPTSLLTVTTTGDPGVATVYYGATDSSDGIANVDYQFTGTGAVATIEFAGTLAPGEHDGTLTLMVCADSVCKRPIGGTPKRVAYKYLVKPGLTITSGADIEAGTLSGNTTSARVTMQLPDGVATYTVTPQYAPWATIAEQTATGFTVLFASVPSGSYSGQLRIDAGGRTVMADLRYDVGAPPTGEHGLVLGTAGAMSALEGGGASQSVYASVPTWNPTLTTSVAYAGDSTGWLTVTPGQGSFTLDASAANLGAGTYQATVTVAGDSYTQAKTLPITFTVGAGLVAVADQLIDVGAETAASALVLSVPTTLAGASPLAWTASTPAGWLTIDSSAGATGDPVRMHIDAATFASLPNGVDQSAVVTLAPAHAGFHATSFTVKLSKHLPEVRFVGPSVLTTGAAHTVWVRGLGFSSASQLSQRLSVSGVGGYTLTPVSDSEFKLQLPAHADGGATISVGNAMGVATHAADVRWLAPATYSYAFIPQVGVKDGLAWDPVRQTLYTVNVDQGTVLAWHWNAGVGWSQTLKGMAASSLGLSPDRQTLVVMTNNAVHLLDPDTLSERSSFAMPAGWAANGWAGVDQGLMVGNDGRVWMPVGTLGWFDLSTQSFGTADFSLVNNVFFYGEGPWGTMSRNGERMVLSQTAAVSPAPPMLYQDESDDRMRTNPAGLTFFYGGALSDNGERFLDGINVRDHDFLKIGTISPPTGVSFRAYVLSPAGDKAYALGYPPDSQNEGTPPQIYVYDSTHVPAGGASLPLLGSFTMADYPACTNGDYPCYWQPQVTISPDGRTIFMAGSKGMIVQPVPDAYVGASTMAAMRRPAVARTLGPPQARTSVR
jgi:hypothetical protein